MPTADDFRAAITAAPDDWCIRVGLADFLAEQGDERGAFAQRWMAFHQRRPFRRAKTAKGVAVAERFAWPWFLHGFGLDDCCHLSRPVFHTMAGHKWGKSHFYYPSEAAAEEALAAALWTLKEAIRDHA